MATKLTRLLGDEFVNPTLSALLDIFRETARSVQDGPIFALLDDIDVLPVDFPTSLLDCIRRRLT